jgi:serine phosphatase RsbU (regulator of sigma subunit)
VTTEPRSGPRDADVDAFLGGALATLLEGTTELPASDITRAVDVAGGVLGATSARLLIADYAVVTLQELGEDGPTGPRLPIVGTLAGRAFLTGEVMVSSDDPALVWVVVAEGSERLGVLELTHPSWSDEARELLDPIVRVLVLVLISKRRYTDVVLRSRRSQPLSIAAEMQWDLLPPLSCTTNRASVSGILEPAYSIGGDSFDYAFNPNQVEFCIIDAVGHGTAAVVMSAAAINSLRNARREGASLETAYRDTGALLETQFGQSYFVTGQFGSLALDTGLLTWVNAGHPLPLHVRDGTFIGELACAPSLPMGLGGSVNVIATEKLQKGDRVLFFTDGVVETRAPGGEEFGVPRLADLLVRATLDAMPPAETARRLSSSIMGYNGAGLTDDATLLLIEYHGPDEEED